MPVFSLRKNGAVLFIRVSTNAKKDDIVGVWRGPDGEERLSIRVMSPPDKGKANKAIIALLANAVDEPKSALTIASGETSRLKTVEMLADPATLAERLAKIIENAKNESKP
ncbi:DUF167 family protein [Hyphococcus flavus]|uniref:UPF0235 protein PUV54_10910 n=1 Tax=Hyphococcus flavus TaxID=1866326 RepID=A0AAE9ZDF6_9PROT|nr:DUF167 family protein [Hyphococcus flavus]WDI30467.1 DUF167 family protein [Hyphococcus flavus]